MRAFALGLLLLTAWWCPLVAQVERDSQPRSSELRERIEKRFAEKVKQELGLNDEQAAQLKEVAMKHGGHRRELRSREKGLRTALDGQIRAGKAADQDSVAKLTQDLLNLRVEYAQSWREEMDQLDSFLTPVQRAQLLVLRERLIQRAHQMRSDHRGFHGRGDAH